VSLRESGVCACAAMAHTATVATDKGLRTQPIENIIVKALDYCSHVNMVYEFLAN
jgi:hypothetical protein